jgi:hypothetical protein
MGTTSLAMAGTALSATPLPITNRVPIYNHTESLRYAFYGGDSARSRPDQVPKIWLPVPGKVAAGLWMAVCVSFRENPGE